VGSYPVSQVVFHTLFFADYYLSQSEAAFLSQGFHAANRELFADYEQLKDQLPISIYTRDQIQQYAQFCRGKVASTLACETESSLADAAAFEGRNFARAELHVYNIRHIQHHAAQISLRLRIDANTEIPWIGSCWRDCPAKP
jgi:hypothetical protein